MKLALGIRKTGPVETKAGIKKIGCKELVVLDPDTGDELEERVCMLWGNRNLITKGDSPLVTGEYLEGHPEDAGYLVLIVRCDQAIEI